MERNISHISEGSRDAPTLLWALQPLIWPLQIFGYFPGFHNKRYNFVYKCYSVMVIIVSTLHAIRYAFLYNSKDDILSAGTMFKVVVNAWSWQAAGATLTLCYGINKHIRPFVRAWDDYKDEYGGSKYASIHSICMRSVLVPNVSLFLLSCASGTLSTFFIPFLNRTLMAPFYPKDGELPHYIIALYYIYHFFLAFVWLQSTVFLCCLVVLLRKEFMKYNVQFKRELSVKAIQSSSPNNRTSFKVEDYRLRYETLCRVVGRFDNMVCLFNFTVYAFDIPMLCFFVYVLFNSQDIFSNDALSIASAVSAFFVALMHLTFVTMTAASLQMAVSTLV